MADEYTQREYWKDVKSLAAEAVEQAAEYDGEVGDAAHQLVDGFPWVFMHYGAQKTLEHSSNDNYAFEELGAEEALAGCESLSEVHVRCAYYALMQDVYEAIEKAKESDNG